VTAAAAVPAAPRRPLGDRVADTLRSWAVPLLSVFTAFVIGAFVIILSDPALVALWRSNPVAALGQSIQSVLNAYGALITGALGNPRQMVSALTSGNQQQIVLAFSPISETIVQTTPLIFTGLAVALGFRAGLFNIGAEGQLIVGALASTLVGFSFSGLPLFIHLPLAVAAGFAGGGLYGFIAGFLKARTGANEVVVTIMLNYISYSLIYVVLRTSLFQRPGRQDPISKFVSVAAQFPQFFSAPELRANWSFILALIAAGLVSVLLFRTTKGFEFRAVGLNPTAARYAGMSIGSTIMLTMFLSGGLAGLAGTTYVLGPAGTLTPGFSPGWGFDAIALALLGRSRPLGVVLAAFLFGALRAGATPMQAQTGIPIDLVVVIQALVIMFVAAPALIRGIYRIKVEGATGTESFTRGWGA
jgi:ABC-type uncharacterized transport system permease subunit